MGQALCYEHYANRSPGASPSRPGGLGGRKRAGTVMPRGTVQADLATGLKNRLASCTGQASQSRYSDGSRKTTMRFSSFGLWKRFITGWLPAFTVIHRHGVQRAPVRRRPLVARMGHVKNQEKLNRSRITWSPACPVALGAGKLFTQGEACASVCFRRPNPKT